MGRFQYYNNKDKIEQKLTSIKKHTLSIKKLINILTLKIGVANSQILSDLEPYTNKTPQNRPYGMNKNTLETLYSLPKYLINKPTIEHEKESQVLIFSFPVVCFTPKINNNKTSVNNELHLTKNGQKTLTLFQLNVVFKLNNGKYSISLHQNCFESGIRQPVFMGRIELGDTHNTKHERVGSTFHIHMPYDTKIDLKYQNTILGGVYHCQPDVFSNQTNISIDSAISIAMKKYNIKNDFQDAVNFKRYRTEEFLLSGCGKEWSSRLLLEPKSHLSFDGVHSLLENNKIIKPSTELCKFILSNL